jgi:ribosome-binding ATPase YchF (GTP1/OBG family)
VGLLEIGIVGKPNVGKSTFFNAVTAGTAQVANYPFTTIRSNVGMCFASAPCVCRELGVNDTPRNSRCMDGVRFIPCRIIDVAGLVPDAHKGRGLGNQFLSDIMQAEVLIHIVDASGTTDAEGQPTHGNDPEHDIAFLEHEIDMFFLEKIKEKWPKVSKLAHLEKKELAKILPERFGAVREEDVLAALHKTSLNPEKTETWREDELALFCRTLREITKPILLAANKADIAPQENIETLQKRATIISSEAENALTKAAHAGLIKYIPGSDTFEALGSANEKQEKALEKIHHHMEKFGGTGVQNVINNAVFNLLSRIVVYPVENENRYSDSGGNVLPDCYLMTQGQTAHDLAYKIHTDLGEHFIHAINAKSKMRIKEDYVLKHNDVIKIVSAR